jgi:hypothetical protein
MLSGQLSDPLLSQQLLARGIRFTDQAALDRALTYADPVDSTERLTDVHALVNDLSMVVELPSCLFTEKYDEVRDRTVATISSAVSSARGFLALDLPPVLRVWEPDAHTLPDPTPFPGVASREGWARVKVGGFPLVVIDPLDDTSLGQLAVELRRIAWRTVDRVTVRLRLDRLAQWAPRTVAALQARIDERTLTRVIARSSEEFVIIDFPRLVHDLTGAEVTNEEELLQHVRAGLLERHLGLLLEYQPLLTIIEVDPDLQGELAMATASGVEVPESIASVLLLRLSLLLPSTPWHCPPTALLVDNEAAIRPLRRLITAQAPGVLVLQRDEVPAWASSGRSWLLSGTD